MRLELKRETIILLFGFTLLNQAIAQELREEPQPVVNREVKGETRIIISTSGPAKFKSHWLDNPSRLVVKFKSRNILSKIGKEVIVNQGVIKKITTDYFGRGPNRPLKSLTFEFTQKSPYKIWQKHNAIILDIQTPLETTVFREAGKEIFVAGETSDVIIKRLEAMDNALTQVAENQPPLEIPKAGIEKASEEINKAKEKVILPKTKVLPTVELPRKTKTAVGMLFLLVGFSLISGGVGFLVWRWHISNREEKLKKELQEKDKRLQQEEILRRAIEETSLKKEKEYGRLKDSFKSLKDMLVKKGLIKKELSPEEKERPWIPEKSQERRTSPRLPLAKNFNKTIILRIESPNAPQSTKSFAKDISYEGLCLETKEKLNEKDLINLRLFFYGDQVPMIKIQAHIIWKRAVGQINYYGVSFDLLEEKDKLELNRYIESNIGRATTEV